MILDMGKIMGFSLWAEWLSSIRIKGRCSFVELTELCRNTTSCNSKRNSVPLRTLCGVRLPDKSWTYGYSAVLCGTINQQEVMVMSEMHLDLTDLLDQDISSFEYFQSLSGKQRKRLMDMDIRSFDELQEAVKRLREQN